MESITELKIVTEPVNCLPSHFLSFIGRNLQVLTHMAALLETPSSSPSLEALCGHVILVGPKGREEVVWQHLDRIL